MVAVLDMDASTPPMRTRFPAATSSAGMKYLYKTLTLAKARREHGVTELR
jgi:hypothetical protein